MTPTRLAEIRATQARADALVAAAQTDATDMSWVIANVDAIADVQAEQVRAVPELLAEVDRLEEALNDAEFKASNRLEKLNNAHDTLDDFGVPKGILTVAGRLNWLREYVPTLWEQVGQARAKGGE